MVQALSKFAQLLGAMSLLSSVDPQAASSISTSLAAEATSIDSATSSASAFLSSITGSLPLHKGSVKRDLNTNTGSAGLDGLLDPVKEQGGGLLGAEDVVPEFSDNSVAGRSTSTPTPTPTPTPTFSLPTFAFTMASQSFGRPFNPPASFPSPAALQSPEASRVASSRKARAGAPPVQQNASEFSQMIESVIDDALMDAATSKSTIASPSPAASHRAPPQETAPSPSPTSLSGALSRNSSDSDGMPDIGGNGGVLGLLGSTDDAADDPYASATPVSEARQPTNAPVHGKTIITGTQTVIAPNQETVLNRPSQGSNERPAPAHQPTSHPSQPRPSQAPSNAKNSKPKPAASAPPANDGSSLPPARAGLHRILNYQLNSVDLTNGSPVAFNPIQTYTTSDTKNQLWEFNPTNTTGQFRIVNQKGDAVLSYTGIKYPFLALHEQVCGQPFETSHTTWEVRNTADGYYIIESQTRLALTSWETRADSASAPLTLEPLSEYDRQQLFSLQVIY